MRPRHLVALAASVGCAARAFLRRSRGFVFLEFAINPAAVRSNGAPQVTILSTFFHELFAVNDHASSNEYLVLSRGKWDASASPETLQRVIEDFYAWHENMVASGKMKRGSRLMKEGKFVSKRSVTDGPFSEAKEVIGGYWFVRARSLEEAAQLLSGSPCLAYGLFYEVRELDAERCDAFAVTAETPVR